MRLPEVPCLARRQAPEGHIRMEKPFDRGEVLGRQGLRVRPSQLEIRVDLCGRHALVGPLEGLGRRGVAIALRALMLFGS